MSSHTGWAGSCGFNVIRRVTQPSLCGVPVIWLNSKWFFHSALASYPLHTQTHGEVTGAGEEGSRKLKFQANWIQTLSLNDNWIHHNKLMIIIIIINTIERKETTYSMFLLTSRQWEELSGNDSLMKSSRGLGWLLCVGVGGLGDTMEETPSASCLICSFWWRRSFLKSFAFRHGGRLASAPTPAPQGEDRRGGELSTKTPFFTYFHAKHVACISRWEHMGKKTQL